MQHAKTTELFVSAQIFFHIFTHLGQLNFSWLGSCAVGRKLFYTCTHTPPLPSESPAPPHHQVFQPYTTCQVSFLCLSQFQSLSLSILPSPHSSDSLNPSTEEASNNKSQPPTIQRPVCFWLGTHIDFVVFVWLSS